MPKTTSIQRRAIPWVAVLFLVVVCAASHSVRAQGTTQCQADATYGTVCSSSVNFTQFYVTAFQTQQQSEWCWAASISMIWAFYGHPVSQAEIVDSVYGGVANIPAPGATMAQVLNGTRTDDNGGRFVSTVTGVYDANANVNELSYNQILSALNNNQPVVIGLNTSQGGAHAVVLTSITYYQTGVPGISIDPSGYNILGGQIFDPWPGNGTPQVAPMYLIPVSAGGNLFFAATIQVTNESNSSGSTGGTSTGSSTGGGGGGVVSLSSILMLSALALARRFFWSVTAPHKGFFAPRTGPYRRFRLCFETRIAKLD